MVRTRSHLCCEAAAKAVEKAFVVQLCCVVGLLTSSAAGLLGCRASLMKMQRLRNRKTRR